jgi:hypothetical protein
MPATLIKNSLPGEALVGIEPELLSRVSVSWQHRLNLFTGRALTESALDAEQANHSGLLATTGQMVSPGVVSGLYAMLDVSGPEPGCYVQAGYGITADGEDVTLAAAMRAPLSSIATAVGTEMLAQRDGEGNVVRTKTFHDFTQETTSKDFAGVLLLQPVIARVVGTPDGAQDASLITDSCQSDPDQYAFEDWQLVDGCRLVFYAWPHDFLALPPAGADWRNRVAYAIYAREATMAVGELFPWEKFGLPIALVGFDPGWKPAFIDRWAVVRTGGFPRRRSTVPDPQDIHISQGSFVSAYNPFLAEARIHQFAEQWNETHPRMLTDQFSFLPAVGALPGSAVDLHRGTQQVFPPNYRITAYPIHTEEIDSVIIASAELAPFDLSVPDEMQLLVPLPDAVYDPRLLVHEEVSPEFQAEVDFRKKGRDDVLRRRKDLQLKANTLLKALKLTAIDLDKNGIDPDVSAEEKEAFASAYTAPDTEAFSTALYDEKTREAIKQNNDPAIADQINKLIIDTYGIKLPGQTTLGSQDITSLVQTAYAAPYTVELDTGLKDQAGKPVMKHLPLISDKDWQVLDQNGLEQFIQALQHKVDKANDLIDLAFLRTQTDIYRQRQHILSNADATRLATSPILAQIAQGLTANATKEELQKFLDDAKAQAKKPEPPAAPSVGGAKPPVAAPPTTSSFMFHATNLMPIFSVGGISKSIGAKVAVPPPPPVHVVPPPPPARTTIRPLGAVHAVTPVKAPAIVPPPVVHPAAPTVHVATTIPATAFLPAPPMLRFFGTAGGLIPSMRPVTAQTSKGPNATDVRQDSPIIGAQLNFRTVSIAQRLQAPPSQEALFFAAANRLEITELLNDLEITLDDLPLIIDAENQPTDPATDPTIHTETKKLGDLKDSNLRSQLTARMLTPVVKADPDQAHVFSVGVRVMEQHTALLRAVEARIQLYQNFISYARCTLQNIQTTLTHLDNLLKQVEDQLTQARHDLAFTQALLNEETARVQKLNIQRAQTIDQYVKYVVFCRGISVDPSLKLPTRPLYPAIISNPVPTCLSSKVSTPPELHDMVSLLREAPVAWIPEMVSLIDRFDRPYLLQQLAGTVRDRALLQQSATPLTSFAQYQTGALPAAMSTVFTKHQTVMSGYRNARAYFQPAILQTETWLTQHAYLQSIASIGDLLESHYASPLVTRSAAKWFQEIGGVAGCLYERVSALDPIYRLRWAEKLADAAMHTDLHDLSVLPTWTEVDYVQRREMQSYVDWLFSRIEPSIQEAHGYMSDLVRVCILLASHAPVDEIIHGEIIHPSPLIVGVIITISVTSMRIFRGMPVLIYSGRAIAAHGTVTDLGVSEVAVSVVNVLQTGTSVGTQDHVQFVTSSIPFPGGTHILKA